MPTGRRRPGARHPAARPCCGLRADRRAEAIDPLEEAEVPTPAAAMLGELARQQADQHPVEGDGRISSLHHLLALLMLPGAPGAGRLLGELGGGLRGRRPAHRGGGGPAGREVLDRLLGPAS